MNALPIDLARVFSENRQRSCAYAVTSHEPYNCHTINDRRIYRIIRLKMQVSGNWRLRCRTSSTMQNTYQVAVTVSRIYSYIL